MHNKDLCFRVKVESKVVAEGPPDREADVVGRRVGHHWSK